jgi:hypothetical protein
MSSKFIGKHIGDTPRETPCGIADEWFHRVKGATRDLVKLCGGLERAGKKCGLSTSQMQRLTSPAHADTISIPAALVLESECGLALVTAVMAEVNGRRIAEPETDGEATTAGFYAAHAKLMRAFGEVMTTVARGTEDMVITPTEAELADRALGTLDQTLTELRQEVAKIKRPLHLVDGGR